jgi:hypothetical protein
LLIHLVRFCRVIAIAVFSGQLEDGLDILGVLGIECLETLESVDPLEDLVDLLLEILRRGPVADDPIDLGAVRVDKEDCRGRPDAELVENDFSVGFLERGLEQDEILGQVVLILGVFEELLTEQFAAPSRIGVEIEEQLLVLGLGLGQGFVERALEEIILGEGRGGEKKKRGNDNDFFHAHLRPGIYIN